jgi:hypothetical protein
MDARAAPSIIVTRMTYVVGKILEVVALMTLGTALIVYGFGEENMYAELVWLLLGSVVFLAGYVLERRSERGR